MDNSNKPESLPENGLTAESSIPKSASKKILVVDDNLDALKLAEAILKKARFEVITLSNPKFIFKLIKEERPEVVVLDIIMPPLDGYTVCQEIRKLYGEKIPILLCTAQSYEQDLVQTAHKEFGANDYILKPVNPEELVSKVKALVKKGEQIKKKMEKEKK